MPEDTLPPSVNTSSQTSTEQAVRMDLSEMFKNVNWTKFLEAIIEGISEGLEKDYLRFLAKCGWVPSPDLLCSAAEPIMKLVQSDQPHRAERLYKLWCLRTYTPERLRNLLDEWKDNPLIERRYSIIRDAVEAHIAGLYTLSVPVLMAQIEGFMWSVDTGTEWINQRKLKQLFTSPMFGIYKSPMERFVNTLLAQFRRDEQAFPNLNRNAVLHGIDTSYSTILNSLQLIIILQILAYIDRELPHD